MSGRPRQVVIVGASAAGLRCAARLRRLQPEWNIVVVEGRQVFSYGACGMPYVVSGDIDSPAELRTTTYGLVRDEAFFRDHKGVLVRAGWRARGVDVTHRVLEIEREGEVEELRWDELVLATGAHPRDLPGQPEHPRVRSFHTFEDVQPLFQQLASGQVARAVIVGAGLVGCELAEALGGVWGAEVHLVEAGPGPLPAVLDPEVGAIVAHHLRDAGVGVHCGSPVEAIEPDEEGVTVRTGGEELRGQICIVAVGVDPAVELGVAAGGRIGKSGALLVDDRLNIGVPHVWAAGDCVAVVDRLTGGEAYRPLGSLANRQGRILANILAGREDRFPPVAGALAAKVFDTHVAAVGLSAASAERSGIEARSVWVVGDDTAHYWPEAKNLYLKLVYEAETLRVLGLQAVSQGDAVGRVNMATQLIHAGGTLHELADLEHAYAPPFSPALDPLATAAFAALNQEDGIQAESPVGEGGEARLDVRLERERTQRPLEAEALAVDAARNGAQPEGAGPYVVVCERGTRSFEVAQLLAGRGIDTSYLGGGLSWQRAMGSVELPDKGGREDDS